MLTKPPSPKYPHITVSLRGHHGHFPGAIATALRTARRAGVGEDELCEFRRQAEMGGKAGYDWMLGVCGRWFSVD